MWQGLDLIPHAPTLIEGDKHHPQVIQELAKLGKQYDEVGGVLVITPEFHDEDVFPINPADPLREHTDVTALPGLRPAQSRQWDGLPFLADSLQRAARGRGVPTALRPGPIGYSVWAPMRWIFPELPVPILPVGLSAMGSRSHFRMGQAIRDAVLEAPKPIAVFVSTNLTYRPDWIRWDKNELPAEGRALDRALLQGLKEGDWSAFDNLDDRIRNNAQPEGGDRLWQLVRGVAGELRGDVRYYGSALGAYGMALVHYETEALNAA